MNPKSKTTQQWTARQAALRLLPGRNRWEVSFLATHNGSISVLGGTVAEFETTVSEQATEAMTQWITSGIVPSGFTTHAPDWFAPAT
jgi:hypothetical protein